MSIRSGNISSFFLGFVIIFVFFLKIFTLNFLKNILMYFSSEKYKEKRRKSSEVILDSKPLTHFFITLFLYTVLFLWFYIYAYTILMALNFLLLLLKPIILFIHSFIISLSKSGYLVFTFFGSAYVFIVISSLFLLSYLGIYGVFYSITASLFLFLLSLIPYFNFFLIYNNEATVILGKWVFVNLTDKADFGFLIDKVSFSFMFLTVSIAFFANIFAFSYFRYEPLLDRFLIFLNLFVISMVLLVISSNLIILFLGWELIGLTSFLLINFWSTRVGTLKSAFKAMFFNKISDFFLFLFILLIYNVTGSFDIKYILLNIHKFYSYTVYIISYDVSLIEVACLSMLSCSFIKSAQLGAHTWLPDSMEAPVPASALIHSATLVSAGIFLILRFYPIVEASSFGSLVLVVVGSSTALYGGMSAMFQSDIKRILAYSTISHCGFLMYLCAININEFVIFYLYIHGFFKACSFLCVGNVLRFSRGYQDFRRMGCFSKYLPFDCICSFICLFNLAGLPFSVGFFVKHLVFLASSITTLGSQLLYSILFLSALTGIVYSFRLFYNVFFDFKKANKVLYYGSNRASLASKYYSNTGVASMYAIFSLIIYSYIVFFFFISQKDFFFSNVDLYNFWSKNNLFEIALPSYIFESNSIHLNWLLILIFTSFTLYSYRQSFKHLNYFDIYSITITLFFFIIANYFFISII